MQPTLTPHPPSDQLSTRSLDRSSPEEILAEVATEHGITAATFRVGFHSFPHAETIAIALRDPAVVLLASGIMLESLHVEM